MNKTADPGIVITRSRKVLRGGAGPMGDRRLHRQNTRAARKERALNDWR